MSIEDGFIAIVASEALEALIASSAACLLILLARRPVRAVFGARVAYALWWLLPAALFAVLLPAPSITPTALELGQASTNMADPAAFVVSEIPTAFDGSGVWAVLAGIWLIGCAAALGVIVVQQHRFRRSLGVLQPLHEGLWKAEARDGLPAVIGLRPKIVLPADFEHRYAPEQQSLVLTHERVHAARGDVYWNLGFALLCALQWFNPLLRVAHRAFRMDQELACDAQVLSLHPHSRRSYGEALLCNSLTFPVAPLGCPAFGTHPLKERITMLTRPLPSMNRILTGFALSLTLGVGFAGLAWAQQSPRIADADLLDIQLELSIDGGPTHTPRVITPAGQEFGIRLEAPDGEPWSFDLIAQRVQEDQIEVTGRVSRDGQVSSQPQLRLQEGIANHIAHTSRDRSGDYRLGMTIRPVDDIVPPVPPAPPTPPAPPSPPAVSAPPAPPAPPAPTAPPQPAPIVAIEAPQGPNTEAAYRKHQPPKYPAEAIREQQQGEVLIRVQVLPDGLPGKVQIARSSGVDSLDGAALEAAAQWQFHPAKRAAMPIESWIIVPVRFSLDELQNQSQTNASTSVNPASYRRLSAPDYPASAKSAGLEGTAVLKVTLDATGTVQTIDVATSSGTELLDRAARNAVEHWAFNPASQAGRGVSSQVLVPVQFIAAHSAAPPFAAPAGALDTIMRRAD